MRFGTEESFVRVGRTLATACAAVVLALLLAGCQSPEPAAEYTLAVASSPCAGAVVDVDGTQCTTPVVLHLSVGASIEVVAAETTSVAVGQRLLFAGWQDGERDPERAIVVGSDTVLTILLRRQYVVSLSADPDSVHPQDSSFWWPEDSVLLLTPWDASSYHFAQWRWGRPTRPLPPSCVCGVVGPTTVTECYRREHQLHCFVCSRQRACRSSSTTPCVPRPYVCSTNRVVRCVCAWSRCSCWTSTAWLTGPMRATPLCSGTGMALRRIWGSPCLATCC